MKKSLISIAVSAAVAFPAFASADVTVSGDARWRMHSVETKFGSFTDVVEASGNSRVRVKIDAKGDGYFMHMRVNNDNGTFDSSGSTYKGDYGWVGVELGPVTLEGGRLNDNWGNRLFSWDFNWDGIQASMNAGPVDLALWRATNTEGGAYDKKGYYTTLPTKDADDITLGLDITGKAGMGGYGIRIQQSSIGKGATGSSISGTAIDAFYRGQVGPGMILAEVNQESGDYYKDVDGDSPQAYYLHWIQNLGKFYYQVAVAGTSNYFTADSHFGPFSTIGTSQDTAVMNFGGMKSLNIVGLFGGMQIMPMTTLQLGLGSMQAKAAKGLKTGSGTAVDLQLKHKVSKSAGLYLTYGTVHMDDKVFGVKYDATAIGAGTNIKF